MYENGFLLLVYLVAMLSVFSLGFIVTAIIIRIFKGKDAFKQFIKEEF